MTGRCGFGGPAVVNASGPFEAMDMRLRFRPMLRSLSQRKVHPSRSGISIGNYCHRERLMLRAFWVQQ
jgi:hypothetical protein